MTTVRVLPSAETVILPLSVTLPSFLLLKSSVCALTRLYDRASDAPSPVTGYSFPSNLPVHSLCIVLPSASTPSTVTFTLSPAASTTTFVFFALPVIFDFASFKFHVPIFASSAATIAATATNSTARLKNQALLFMKSPCGFLRAQKVVPNRMPYRAPMQQDHTTSRPTIKLVPPVLQPFP